MAHKLPNYSNNKHFLYLYAIYINFHIYIVNNLKIDDLSVDLTHKNMDTILNIFNDRQKTLLNLNNNHIFYIIIQEIYAILDEEKSINSKKRKVDESSECSC